MTVTWPINLIEPIIVAAIGVVFLWYPAKYRRRAQRQHSARVAELDRGAEERFFEERRSLDAYRPPSSDRAWRLIGLLMLAAGIVQSILVFAR